MLVRNLVKHILETYIKEESYNGGSVERFNKIIKDSKEHIILIGVSSIFDDVIVNNDGLIAKYNADLEKIAVVSYGDEKYDYFNDIINDEYIISAIEYSQYSSKMGLVVRKINLDDIKDGNQ